MEESKDTRLTVQELQHEVSRLRKEAGRADAKDKEVVRLHGVIASLDEERDRLTAELDLQAEAIAAMTAKESTMKLDLGKTEQSASFAQREVIRLSQAVDGRDRQIESLRLQLESAKARAEQSNRRTEDVTRELTAAAEDIMNMTRENQVVTAEVTGLRADNAALQQFAQDANEHMKALEQRLSDVETDKVELLTVYQAVCDERKHLTTEVEASAGLRHKLEEQTAALASEAGNLRAALSAEQERRDVAERAFAAMQASLDQTTRELAERLHGRPVEGRSTSELLAQASEFGAEVDSHRQAMASAMDQTAHNFSLMMEAKAEADATRASAESAFLERDAALHSVNMLRDQCHTLEEVAKEERLAHVETQLLVTQLQQELNKLRAELSATSVQLNSSVHMASPPRAEEAAVAGAEPSGEPDKATAAAFAALHAENESLKADLRQALARLRRADEALGRAQGRVGGGEALETDAEEPTTATGTTATGDSQSSGGVVSDTASSAAATTTDIILSPVGRRAPATFQSRHDVDWASEFQLLEAELRAVTARCATLETTIRRQAATITALQTERQRTQRHLLRYEAEVTAQRAALAQAQAGARGV